MRASNIEFDEEFGYVSAEGEQQQQQQQQPVIAIKPSPDLRTSPSTTVKNGHGASSSPSTRVKEGRSTPSTAEDTAGSSDEESEFAHYNLMVFSSLAASRRRQLDER